MNLEISCRQSRFQITNFKEKTYRVDVTGATISSVMSVPLLHRYCSSLPHDEYDSIVLLICSYCVMEKCNISPIGRVVVVVVDSFLVLTA